MRRSTVLSLPLQLVFPGFWHNRTIHNGAGSAKTNGREPKSCLGRVFKFKLGCFCYGCHWKLQTNAPTFEVKNSAQVLSCQLKFVHECSILLSIIFFFVLNVVFKSFSKFTNQNCKFIKQKHFQINVMIIYSTDKHLKVKTGSLFQVIFFL